jgi:TonB family protein
MRPKPILLLGCLLVITGVNAQTPAQNTSQIWRTYTVKDEKFAVDLPAFPALGYRKVRMGNNRLERLEISFGAYADGVVYTVNVFEAIWPRDSLDSFIKKQIPSKRTWDLSAKQTVKLDGVEGKAFGSIEKNAGMVQFFTKGDRLFQFMAYGAPLEDARMTQFFSSISLTRKKDSLNIADNSVRTHVINTTPGSDQVPDPDPAAKIYASSKEVDKKVHVGLKLEPAYTEEARQHQTEGVVVLKCVFSANGTITNISTVKGLPYGLTERAIAAARQLKFIPAMKDGQFVSQWMTVEFHFNLY